jgi:hypothetical protein
MGNGEEGSGKWEVGNGKREEIARVRLFTYASRSERDTPAFE